MGDETSDAYRIIFARNVDRAHRGEPGTILIAPNNTEWNDFGFKIRANMIIYPRSEFAPQMEAFSEVYLGFAKGSAGTGDTRELMTVLDREQSASVSPDKLPAFFTMLPSMQAYRELVARLGPQETRVVLLAVHDMVAADDSGSVVSWFREAQTNKVFLIGFLRFSEAFFAWKNAAPVLMGEEFEEIGRLSERLRITFQLQGRPNAHDLDFQFALKDAVLPKRFAVVIGKNGVGKSQALNRIAKAALSGSSELTDGDGQRPAFARLLAFYPTASAASVFPSQRRRHARVWYRRFSLGSPGPRARRNSTSDLIVQVARSTERIARSSRMRIFLNALNAIEGYEELALQCRREIGGFISIQDLTSGGEGAQLERFATIDLRKEPVRKSGEKGYPLSSGELAFLRFAALTSLYIENSSLLLFDEPETHLHPNFISRFVMLLDSLLKQTGSAAILSTHSVYFVREAFEDQVRILRSDEERRISVIVPRLKTFGADVGAISYFVFGEDEPSRLAQQVEERIVENAGSWEEVFEQFKDDISLELLGEIRERIEGSGPTPSGA